jgi:hypothetical protein
MDAKESGGLTKERRFRCLASLSPNVTVGVHNNNFQNARRAILERIFCVEGADGNLQAPPHPRPGVFKAALRQFRATLGGYLPSTNRCSYDEFLSLVPARKKKTYLAAVESLAAVPVSLKDSFLSTFIKMEKILFSVKPDPAPRVIQPRHPRYNVEVGRFLKPLEHQIYEAVASLFGSPTIMKGYNASEQGRIIADKWYSFICPVAIGLDASRFDQHVSTDALRWEHGVYVSCFHDRDERAFLKDLLKWQLNNRGFCRLPDGTIKYKTDGCRMSGDMNTALGNCILMCAMVWSLMKRLGIDKYELVNNGDDCVLIVESCHLEAIRWAIPHFFLSMGFTMKVEDPVFELEKIEFCQTHPLHLGNGEYVMVRNCPNAIAKDCVCTLPLVSEEELEYWCDAVGQCGLALTGGVPIYQEFYSALIRLGRDSSNTRIAHSNQMEGGFWQLAKGMHRSYKDITPEARLSFYIAFDILPDEQVAIEQYYSNLALDLHATVPEGFLLSFFPHAK